MMTDEELEALGLVIGVTRMACAFCEDESLDCNECAIRNALDILRKFKKKIQTQKSAETDTPAAP